jgi:hypothetical protein
MAPANHFQAPGPFRATVELTHDAQMRQDRQPGFSDSDFDWDALTTRAPHFRGERPNGVMDLLGWIVLVLLIFCPPLGYALATLWH